MFKKLLVVAAITFGFVALSGCGVKVEVPPAHVGKIMTKDGYQEGLIPTSKLRLPACMTYCDRMVLLDVSDSAYNTPIVIFIPKDKLNLSVAIQTTLSVSPKKTQEIFNSIAPAKDESEGDYLSVIPKKQIFTTYAQQIIEIEAREYLSQFSIGEISSSIEQINSQLSARISKSLADKTPFTVRNIGITNIQYPKIITDAQENAAKRREQIQQEEAQLEISKVALERELQEARLTRQIEKEKAETEAEAQRIQAVTIDQRVLDLRKLENQRAWIDKWNGQLPTTALNDSVPMINLSK